MQKISGSFNYSFLANLEASWVCIRRRPFSVRERFLPSKFIFISLVLVLVKDIVRLRSFCTLTYNSGTQTIQRIFGKETKILKKWNTCLRWTLLMCTSGCIFRNICLCLQSWAKYLRQILVFLWNSTLRKKFQFLFFRIFLLVLAIFLLWEEDWAISYNSMKFWDVADTS